MLWDLLLTFFKMGAETFGGGYAMLPILQREVAENKKWSTEEERRKGRSEEWKEK